MKISSLFDLLTDAKDVLDAFEGVETREQIVSALERLKHQDTELLLDCLTSLAVSVNRALNDTMEMSAVVDDDEPDDDGDLETELAKIAESVTPEEDKTTITGEKTPDTEPKKAVQI